MLNRSRIVLVFQLAAVLLWFVLLRPHDLGGPASYVAVSGESMEPTIHNGALAFLFSQREYHVGDIVAYQVDTGYVIHRIIGETSEGFVVQGDNKEYPDPWKPTGQEIVGKMLYQIPDGGRVVAYLRQPMLIAPIVGIVAMLFILFPGQEHESRRRRTRGLIGQEPSLAFDYFIEPSGTDQSDRFQWLMMAEPGPKRGDGESRARELFDSENKFQPRCLRHALPQGMAVYAVQSDSRLRWEYVLDLRSPYHVSLQP